MRNCIASRSLTFIAALSAALALGAAAYAAPPRDPPVYVPAPLGDFNSDGQPIKPAPSIVPPQADPQHPNPGAAEILPAASRRLGEEGTVTLLLTVNAEGKVSDAKVQGTSGYERLDEAAQKAAVRWWRFLPGRVNGTPATMQMPIKVSFK